jgi:hypothetical protein
MPEGSLSRVYAKRMLADWREKLAIESALA